MRRIADGSCWAWFYLRKRFILGFSVLDEYFYFHGNDRNVVGKREFRHVTLLVNVGGSEDMLGLGRLLSARAVRQRERDRRDEVAKQVAGVGRKHEELQEKNGSRSVKHTGEKTSKCGSRRRRRRRRRRGKKQVRTSMEAGR